MTFLEVFGKNTENKALYRSNKKLLDLDNIDPFVDSKIKAIDRGSNTVTLVSQLTKETKQTTITDLTNMIMNIDFFHVDDAYKLQGWGGFE